jgi:hypothetical protein
VVDILFECRRIFSLGVGRGLQRVQPAQEQVVLQPTRLPLLLEAGALLQHHLQPGAITSLSANFNGVHDHPAGRAGDVREIRRAAGGAEQSWHYAPEFGSFIFFREPRTASSR